jgi:hypothetical protein
VNNGFKEIDVSGCYQMNTTVLPPEAMDKTVLPPEASPLIVGYTRLDLSDAPCTASSVKNDRKMYLQFWIKLNIRIV